MTSLYVSVYNGVIVYPDGEDGILLDQRQTIKTTTGRIDKFYSVT
jgi:hypothetical protein